MSGSASKVLVFDKKLIEDKDYWVNRLSKVSGDLSLPLAPLRLSDKPGEEKIVNVKISDELYQKLSRLTVDKPFLVFTSVVTALQLCLHRYSGDRTIIVGTPGLKTEGPPQSSNAVAIMTEVSPALTIKQLLLSVRQSLLDAYAHQDYPFHLLLKDLGLHLSPGRCPLFDVAVRFDQLHTDMAEVGCGVEIQINRNEGRLGLSLRYGGDLYEQASVERLATHLTEVLGRMVEKADERVRQIEVMGEQERVQVVEGWNDTRQEKDSRSVIELMLEQACARPGAVAVEYEGERISYREMMKRAEALAGVLREKGAGPERMVGIYLDRSIELAVAVVGVMMSGAAYVPLEVGQPAQRVKRMIEQAGIKVVVSRSKEWREMEGVEGELGFEVVKLGEQDQADSRPMMEEVRLEADTLEGDTAAYVIYTSGSTGEPKGVILQHGALCNLVLAQIDRFDIHPDSRILQFASLGFDASVSEIFTALACGATLCLADKKKLLPGRELISLLEDSEITHVTLPPSALAVLPQKRLPKLKVVISAGEATSAELVRRWATDRCMLNAYGPTEATVCATVSECLSPERKPPIGKPIANAQVYILDAEMRPAPIGIPGEIYIGGAGLARGYLNQPQFTAERFLPNPFSRDTGARLYKTGDIARYLPDGSIEFMGRNDLQLKVRGYRVEPGEIEARLIECPRVREAAVVAREDALGNKRLVAFIVTDEAEAHTVNELRESLKVSLPDYMAPAQYVLLDRLPRTANGKIDRKALPDAPVSRSEMGGDLLAARTPAEQTLAEIWAEVLGLEQVGIQDNFFALGGNSLLATQVISRVANLLRVEMPLYHIFEAPTVAEFAKGVEKKMLVGGETPIPPIERVSREQTRSLSYAQQRLWVLNQIYPETPAYNVPAAIRMKGNLDRVALEKALGEINRRHEALRTVFSTVEGEPAQVILPPKEFFLPATDLSTLPPPEREDAALKSQIEEAGRPFDLTRGPVWRCRLLRMQEDEHILILTIHHIVCDGWSVGLLIHEMAQLYPAIAQARPSPLPELPVQYADFSAWQQRLLESGAMDNQLSYWKQQLRGAPQSINLPTDRPRPAVQSFRGAIEKRVLSQDVYDSLKELSQMERSTLFIVLLTAFDALLYSYTGQDDICVGTDVANRNRLETEGLIGFFVNHLVLRADLSGNPSFRGLLRRMHRLTLEAYANQDLPFDKLVKALKVKRRPGSSPLFDVLFVLQNAPMPALDLPGIEIAPIEFDPGTSKFDIALMMEESQQGLVAAWTYNTDLFDPTIIKKMASDFENLLRVILAQPETSLRDLAEAVRADSTVGSAERSHRRKSRLKSLRQTRRQPVDLAELKLVKTGYFEPEAPSPLVIEPVARDIDIVEWAAGSRQLIEAELLKHGAILFRGFGVKEAFRFEQFCQSICQDLFDQYGDLPRESVAGKIYGSTPYPHDETILFHNESSHMNRWPMKIWFYCAQAATEGGETPIVDCRKVYRLIDSRLASRLAEKGLIYIRNFAEGLDVSWQEFFKTSDRSAVEQYCKQSRMGFEWKGAGGLSISQLRPAVAKHPKTGEEVFFNQIQLHHPSCLPPAVRESLLSVFSEDDLPRNVCYGDGSPIEDSVVEQITEVYRQVAIGFAWMEGDILMLDNMLTAHGRKPFVGDRKILVAMGEMAE